MLVKIGMEDARRMEVVRKIKKCSAIFISIFLLTASVYMPYGNVVFAEGEVDISAPSAVLMEGSTGEIIYEKNANERLIPASITKIMTLLLIFESMEKGKFTLEDEVTVSEYAASMGGSQVYLEPFETQKVNDMIKCISIASANDASVAMAEYIAGSEEEFVKMMNQKAIELGMKDTHFLNCCGLDDDITEGHYSSAYDVALMSRELITKYPQISEYSTVWMDTITHVTKKGESEFGLTNTNKLVRIYKGITGLKTGSTSKAKYCLSATAKRDGMDLIAVVMKAPEPKVRFQDASKLLDYGFANCSLFVDDNKDVILEDIPIKVAVKDRFLGCVLEPFSYVCLKGVSKEAITKEIQLNETIVAPIEQGDQVGVVVFSLDGKKIGEVPIVSQESVKKATYFDYVKKAWKRFFMSMETKTNEMQ